MNDIQSYLIRNYNFQNYRITNDRLTFIATLDKIYYISFRIANHDSYQTPTIYFQIYRTVNDTITPVIDPNVVSGILSHRYSHLCKYSQQAQPTTTTTTTTTTTPFFAFALHESGYFYIHPCQSKHFPKQLHHLLPLQLSTLGIY